MANNYAILDTPIGGDYVLISEFSATAAAALDITDIPQTYKAMDVYVDNISLSTSGDLTLLVSTDNGATFLTTAIYTYYIQGIDSGATVVSYNPANNQNQMYLWPPAYTLLGNHPVTYKFTVMNYTNVAGTGYIGINWQASLISPTNVVGGGYDGWSLINTGGAINAIRLYNPTGNVTAIGRYYGIS